MSLKGRMMRSSPCLVKGYLCLNVSAKTQQLRRVATHTQGLLSSLSSSLSLNLEIYAHGSLLNANLSSNNDEYFYFNSLPFIYLFSQYVEKGKKQLFRMQLICAKCYNTGMIKAHHTQFNLNRLQLSL